MKNYGNILRNEGMQLALFNAEDKSSGWADLARKYLERYLSRYPASRFQAEDVRRWAYSRGLTLPPHDRAWGPVITKAKREGLIKFVGYENVTNPLAHSTPAAVWRGGQNV